jgi:hypothetical protein
VLNSLMVTPLENFETCLTNLLPSFNNGLMLNEITLVGSIIK